MAERVTVDRTPMIIQRVHYHGEVYLNAAELAAWARESETIQRDQADEEGADAFRSAAEWFEELAAIEE